MAINKKGKRKIIVKDREFYWYMKLTNDWMYIYNTSTFWRQETLNILSTRTAKWNPFFNN